MIRFFNWVAALFGYRLIAEADVEAAIAKAEVLVQYAQRSGALNCPRRIKARGRVIASASAILENLSKESMVCQRN